MTESPEWIIDSRSIRSLPDSMKKVLVFCMTENGGLAEYVYHQSEAFERRGWNVVFLCSPKYFHSRDRKFDTREILFSMPPLTYPALIRRVLLGMCILMNYLLLAIYIIRVRPAAVLLDSYREYFAPIWAWMVKVASLVSRSFMIANLHDPVRNFQVGPLWWHNFSVRQGYSFLHLVTVHSEVPEEAMIPASVRKVIVPHGVFACKPSGKSRAELRASLGIPIEGFVVLSFGFVRDNKNIDLLIRAIDKLPGLILVVAGRSQTSNDKPVSYYRDLANSLNVAQRCIFIEEFVPPERIPLLFEACDLVALTYSSSFYSQSGVLSLAASSTRPVLVSSAKGPLKETVEKFGLGKVISPDNLDEIIFALRDMSLALPEPDWEAYYRFAGWDQNVSLIEKEFDEQ